MTVGDLGHSPGDAISPEHTMLEVFLAGGSVVGVETLPGLRADLDLDGDGLETFVLDETHAIARCWH